jgi:hypothetical protein
LATTARSISLSRLFSSPTRRSSASSASTCNVTSKFRSPNQQTAHACTIPTFVIQ